MPWAPVGHPVMGEAFWAWQGSALLGLSVIVGSGGKMTAEDGRRWAAPPKSWVLAGVVAVLVEIIIGLIVGSQHDSSTTPQRNFGSTSMLSGWLPSTVQLVSFVVLALAVGLRSRRWWIQWMPIAAAAGVVTALAVRFYITYEGLTGDPAPVMFWIWTALSGASLAILALGWRGAPWWRRAASALVVPLCLLCTVLQLNIWVGYVRTVEAARIFLTSGPFPNQTDMATVKAMAAKGVVPDKGRIVPVTTGADGSHFKHRGEFVYLPPEWFTSSPPPQLPVLMMIGGVFGKSSDWVGEGQNIANAFAAAHGGSAPVMVFVDQLGAFGKDTECVNGPRGNAADHLTKDVVPFMISNFGVSSNSANWGIVGWSMGGTCAIDLTVMHPDLFSAFVDIAGELGPGAGTKQQTIDRLFGGNEEAWASFDPTTVMTRHGSYTGVSGLFAVEAPTGSEQPSEDAVAAKSLAQTAAAARISCAILEVPGKHDWSFGPKVFRQTLPWLGGQLGTPGVPRIPLPGAP
jgi:S-formylglutathione hydrolase FrmB